MLWARLLTRLRLRSRLVAWLRISARLLVISARLLVIAARLLVIAARLLRALLELRPLLLELWLLTLLKLRLLPLLLKLWLLMLLLELRLLMLLLELRPVLAVAKPASVVAEVVRLASAVRIAMKAHGPSRGYGLRMAAVVSCVESTVSSRSLEMLLLDVCRSLMPLAHGHPLFTAGIMTDTSRPAVISNVVVVNDRGVVHDRLIHVGVVNNRSIHIHNRGVICEFTAVPFSSHKADSHITESIIHTAIEANVRTPIARMKDVQTARPAPIGWCP